MYSRIGFTALRGSGTNGYIRANKFFVKPKTNQVIDSAEPFGSGQGTAGLSTGKPDKEIPDAEPDRKPQSKLRLIIFEGNTAKAYIDADIAEKLAEFRKAKEARQEKDEEEGEVVATPTHQKKGMF